MKRAEQVYSRGEGLNGGRRVLVWAAATVLGALVTSFPLAAAASGESSADLAVAQVATNPAGDAIGTTSKLYAGQVVTYTVTVTNNGPSEAASVTLTETAPSEVDSATLKSCDAQAAECSVDANFAEYVSGTPLSLGTLAAQSSKEVVFRGTVEAGTLPGDITNTVSATSATADPETANNIDGALVTPVNTLADLSVSQVAKDAAGKSIGSTNKARAGDVITYVATVKNAGPSEARNVKVKNTFDSGLTNLQSCAGACSSDAGFRSYQSSALLSLGTLGAGSTKTVSFRGTLPTTITAATDVTNVVSAKSYNAGTVAATADSDTGDATSTITITVNEAASSAESGTSSSTNGPTSATSGSSTAGVYFGPLGAPTYFEPQLRTKTVVIHKEVYTSAFGGRIPAEASAPVVDSATSAVVVPVASRIVRAPEEVWLLLPVGLLLIIWITYLVLEPYEDQLLASRSKLLSN